MPLISLNDSHSRAHVHSSVFSRANINNNICKSFHYYLSSLRVARVRAARSVSANMYQANHRINFDALLLCSCCIHVEWPRSNAQHQAPGNVCAIATYWMSSASFFIHPAIVRSAAVEIFIPFVFRIEFCVLRLHISSPLAECYWFYWSKCVFTIEIKRTEYVHGEVGQNNAQAHVPLLLHRTRYYRY